MSDHASHFIRDADGGLVHMPYFGCAPCTAAVAAHRASGDRMRILARLVKQYDSGEASATDVVVVLRELIAYGAHR